jgi:uncharacterized protein
MISPATPSSTGQIPEEAAQREESRASLPARNSIRSIDLTGPSGRLEALLNEGSPSAPYAALVCHPHPLGGGTMHNKVVYHAMKVMNDPAWGLKWPVLRFNFRGTGLSEGEYDGEAEAEDVRAALDWLRNRFHRPLVVVGYSFGAMMSVLACCNPAEEQTDVKAIAAIGLPVQDGATHFHYPLLAGCTKPKLFLSGDTDQYAPVDGLKQLAASAAEPKRLVLIAGSDHFFASQMETLQFELVHWLKEQLQ